MAAPTALPTWRTACCRPSAWRCFEATASCGGPAPSRSLGKHLSAKRQGEDDAVLIVNDDVRIEPDFLAGGLVALTERPNACIQAIGFDPSTGDRDLGAIADLRHLRFRAASRRRASGLPVDARPADALAHLRRFRRLPPTTAAALLERLRVHVAPGAARRAADHRRAFSARRRPRHHRRPGLRRPGAPRIRRALAVEPGQVQPQALVGAGLAGEPQLGGAAAGDAHLAGLRVARAARGPGARTEPPPPTANKPATKA